MYINDVLRKVRKYYPSEYEPEEMYGWCNEVSSKLSVEERQIYRRKNLPIADDGTVLLPEGVDILNIERIIAGGTELTKEDMRNGGLVRVHSDSGSDMLVLEEPLCGSKIATVIYLEPYTPIRMIKYIGKLVFYPGDDAAIGINMTSEFIPGDILKIAIGEERHKNIPVMAIEYPSEPGGMHLLKIPKECMPYDTQKETDGIITRTITEKTVCDAPYDSMYVDYLLMKISEYQRDWTAYAQYKQSYESLCGDYRKYVEERKPSKETYWKCWW